MNTSHLDRLLGCGLRRVLQSRANPAEGGIVTLRCRRWSCPYCRQKNIEALAEHTERVLAPLPCAYVVECADDEARRVCWRVRRADGQYRRVLQPGGRSLVLSSVPVKGAHSVPTASAVRLVRDALEHLPAKVSRPVLSSHAWALRSRATARYLVHRTPVVSPIADAPGLAGAPRATHSGTWFRLADGTEPTWRAFLSALSMPAQTAPDALDCVYQGNPLFQTKSSASGSPSAFRDRSGRSVPLRPALASAGD